MRKKNGRRGHVDKGSPNNSKATDAKANADATATSPFMVNELASSKLVELQRICQHTLNPRRTRLSTSDTSDPSDEFLELKTKYLKAFQKECTPSKVFGCEAGGVLAPPPHEDRDNQNGRNIDRAGTAALRRDIRRSWEARSVQGDGNCLWRAASRSFLRTERYWKLVKLVTLAYAAAHFRDIHQLVLANHFDNDITAKYYKTAFVPLGDGTDAEIPDLAHTDLMLLASVSQLCPFGVYAGSIASRLIAEALGIKVKQLHPMDTTFRKKQGINPQKRGTDEDGAPFDDARRSHTFVPLSTSSVSWRVQDSIDQSIQYRDEISVVLVSNKLMPPRSALAPTRPCSCRGVSLDRRL